MATKRRKRRVGAYALAAASLGKSPRREQDFTRNGYTLTRWRQTRRVPRLWVYTVGRRGEGAFVIRDHRSFSKLLKAFALTLDEADEILRLYDHVRPSYRRVMRAAEDLWSLDEPVQGWHAPERVRGGGLVFFAQDPGGAVDGVTVSPDMTVQVTKVRKGKHWGFR